MSWPMVAYPLVPALEWTTSLSLDGWQQPEPTYVWNPTTQHVHVDQAPDSDLLLRLAQLPNGEVMTVGGYGELTTGQIGIVDTAIFNPSTGTWRRVANMHTPRWYPHCHRARQRRLRRHQRQLHRPQHWADTPELYDPTANTWTLLSKVSTPQVHEEEYPFSYLDPERQRVHDRPVRGRLL